MLCPSFLNVVKEMGHTERGSWTLPLHPDTCSVHDSKYSYCGFFSNVQEMRVRHKETFLKKHNLKLGFMSVFVKAAAFALQDQPTVNAGERNGPVVLR